MSIPWATIYLLIIVNAYYLNDLYKQIDRVDYRLRYHKHEHFTVDFSDAPDLISLPSFAEFHGEMMLIMFGIICLWVSLYHWWYQDR